MSEAAPSAGADSGKPASSPLEDFLKEFPSWWRSIPHTRPFLAALFAWTLLFHFFGNSTFGYIDTHSLFVWLVRCYEHSEDDQHGYLVPFLVFGLIWWKRGELSASIDRRWAPGMALFLFAAGLHVVGYLVQQARLSVISYILGIFGLVAWFWGRRAVATAFFPLILLFFCVPLTAFSEFITFPLRILVTKLSIGFSHTVLGADVFRDGSQIVDGRGRRMYDVAPACSGIRSLITIGLLSLIYGFMNFRSNWRRLVIILAAMPMAVVANTARIVVVIIVGEVFGVEAGSAIETKLGFVTFAVAILGTFGLGWLLREGAKPGTQSPPSPKEASA